MRLTVKLSKGTICPLVPHIGLLWMDSHHGTGNHILLWPMGKRSSLILNIPSNPGPRQRERMHGLTIHFSCSIRFSTSHVFHSLFLLNKKLWRGKKIERVEKRGRIDAPSERCRAEQGPGCIVSPAPRRSIAQLEVRRRLKSLVEWSTAKNTRGKTGMLRGKAIDRQIDW